eukprot:m.159848 g.159848  ORF g.159848 m.159848 type:complete len:442 (-) comp14539_c0_seq3:138-1463(-)
MQCTVCLDDTGEVIQRGCCCRGDAGAVHLSCLAQLATHRSTRADGEWSDVMAWVQCETCKEMYTGPAQLGLARTLWDKLKDEEDTNETRLWAQCVFGTALEDKGLLVEAEAMKKNRLEVLTRLLGPDHVNTALAAEHLAFTCESLGQAVRAIDLYTQALEALEKEPEKWPREIVGIKSNLANAYWAEGRFAESVAIQREVFTTRKAELGMANKMTLAAGSDLALGLTGQGKNEEAAELYKEVIATQKRVLGPDHPHPLKSTMNLAVCYMYLKQYNDAEAVTREALVAHRRVFGPLHPDTSRTVGNLGLFIELQGRHEEAEKVLREAVEQLKESVGTDHTEYLFPAATLGGTLAELGRHGEAQTLLREVHTRQVSTLGRDHPRSLRTQSILGGALLSAGAAEEGATLLKEAHARQSELLGDPNDDTQASKARLERWKVGQGE